MPCFGILGLNRHIHDMRPNIIGWLGLLLIAVVLFFYLRDVSNAPPIMLGETSIMTAYVTGNNIVPHGRGATHKIDYEYSFNNKKYSDHYYSNKRISRVSVGDSLKIEVSIHQPHKNKIISYYLSK